MSQQVDKHDEHAGTIPSRSILVRFQHHLHEFWRRYGVPLGQAIARRRGRAIASLAILSCLIYLGYHLYDSRNDAALGGGTREEAVPTVTVVLPKSVPPTETITLPGDIVGWYEAPIYARVTGYVKMWYKRYGDEVKTGDLLAEISTPDLDAEYRQAQANLKSARARYKLAEVTAKRLIALRPTHAISEQSITVHEQHMKTEAALVKAAEQKVKNIEAFIGFKKIIA
ncbi:MAG TPA: biotin/lipoyl-binding protein, partial [Nitrospira sp.]|nr:biotin/lipoyl-binding protein [Nitrospira sp.]